MSGLLLTLLPALKPFNDVGQALVELLKVAHHLHGTTRFGQPKALQPKHHRIALRIFAWGLVLAEHYP